VAKVLAPAPNRFNDNRRASWGGSSGSGGSGYGGGNGGGNGGGGDERGGLVRLVPAGKQTDSRDGRATSSMARTVTKPSRPTQLSKTAQPPSQQVTQRVTPSQQPIEKNEQARAVEPPLSFGVKSPSTTEVKPPADWGKRVAKWGDEDSDGD